jgi:hypothetical protein
VAGLGVRVFTDEMVDTDLALALQQQGYDVLSCRDAGRSNQRISDENQLAFATQEGRAILSFNARDFLRIDGEWKAAGRAHAGIVVVARTLSIGDLIRYVARHLDTYGPDAQANVLLWLDTNPEQ